LTSKGSDDSADPLAICKKFHQSRCKATFVIWQLMGSSMSQPQVPHRTVTPSLVAHQVERDLWGVRDARCPERVLRPAAARPQRHGEADCSHGRGQHLWQHVPPLRRRVPGAHEADHARDGAIPGGDPLLPHRQLVPLRIPQGGPLRCRQTSPLSGTNALAVSRRDNRSSASALLLSFCFPAAKSWEAKQRRLICSGSNFCLWLRTHIKLLA
jgi:hypothetical protein